MTAEDKLSNRLFEVVFNLKLLKISITSGVLSTQTLLPTLKWLEAVQMSLTDESQPDEVKQVVQKRTIDSIVYHEKDCGVKASYTVTYKKADENLNL